MKRIVQVIRERDLNSKRTCDKFIKYTYIRSGDDRWERKVDSNRFVSVYPSTFLLRFLLRFLTSAREELFEADLPPTIQNISPLDGFHARAVHAPAEVAKNKLTLAVKIAAYYNHPP